MATTLEIKELIVDPTIQIRRGNHEQTVRKYMDAFEKLPPIDVFKTSDGLLVADGFHRVAAGMRLGIKKIGANLHRGSRDDALEFAVVANTKNADALSPEERDEGIRRLKGLHADWSQAKIAEAMSVSDRVVGSVFAADRVKKSVAPILGERISGATMVGDKVKDSHLAVISAADKSAWKPLVKAAAKRSWTVEETRDAVQVLHDRRTPVKVKEDVLAGRADPRPIDEDGRFTVPSATVSRKLRELESQDATLALYRALEDTQKLRQFSMRDIADGVAEDRRLDKITKEVKADVEFWGKLLSELEKAARRMEVVS